MEHLTWNMTSLALSPFVLGYKNKMLSGPFHPTDITQDTTLHVHRLTIRTQDSHMSHDSVTYPQLMYLK